MYIVISYDIESDKRRNKIHNLLKDYGISFGSWAPRIQGDNHPLLCVVIGIVLCVACRNSLEIKERFPLNWYGAIALSLIAVLSLIRLYQGNTFLYFQF